MIVVTGATGRLGGLTVEALLARVPPSEVGVSVRSPEKAAALAERGVRVRAGDYTDVEGLTGSFEGARALLLVSAATLGEEALRQHANAIEAATRAGVGRIVYTSHQAASPDSAFAPARDHAATEALLADSGLAWTSLRDGFHAATVSSFLRQAPDGVLRAPLDGPVSWTAHEDLGEAAALTLLTAPEHDGPTPPLTGAAALDLAAATAPAGFAREVVGDEDYVLGLIGHGVPEPMARMLLTMFLASRAGEFDVVDPYLAELLGRDPVSVLDVVSADAGTATAAR